MRRVWPNLRLLQANLENNANKASRVASRSARTCIRVPRRRMTERKPVVPVAVVLVPVSSKVLGRSNKAASRTRDPVNKADNKVVSSSLAGQTPEVVPRSSNKRLRRLRLPCRRENRPTRRRPFRLVRQRRRRPASMFGKDDPVCPCPRRNSARVRRDEPRTIRELKRRKRDLEPRDSDKPHALPKVVVRNADPAVNNVATLRHKARATSVNAPGLLRCCNVADPLRCRRKRWPHTRRSSKSRSKSACSSSPAR